METKECIKCKSCLSVDMFELRADTGKKRNQCKDCRGTYVKQYKSGIKSGERKKKEIVVVDNQKECYKCLKLKDLSDFPTRKTNHGYRHECKTCKQEGLHEYYQTTYNEVRRNRIKQDPNLRLIRAQRNYVYKCLTKFKNKNKCSLQYLNCDLTHLKKWIEYQFDHDMSWDNYGTLWTVDHVLPLSQFNLLNASEQYIAFDWKNLQPSKTNFQKSDKILFSEWLKVIMIAHKFITQNNIDKNGYQGVSESLHWLRDKLRYGKNPTDNNGQSAAKEQEIVHGSETKWFWVF